jgi:hypothetical protein
LQHEFLPAAVHQQQHGEAAKPGQALLLLLLLLSLLAAPAEAAPAAAAVASPAPDWQLPALVPATPGAIVSQLKNQKRRLSSCFFACRTDLQLQTGSSGC